MAKKSLNDDLLHNLEKTLQCGVCLEPYDHENHRPLLLKCGHTVCFLCVAQLDEYLKVQCPECRANTYLSSQNYDEELTLNRTMLSFIDLAAAGNEEADEATHTLQSEGATRADGPQDTDGTIGNGSGYQPITKSGQSEEAVPGPSSSVPLPLRPSTYSTGSQVMKTSRYSGTNIKVSGQVPLEDWMTDQLDEESEECYDEQSRRRRRHHRSNGRRLSRDCNDVKCGKGKQLKKPSSSHYYTKKGSAKRFKPCDTEPSESSSEDSDYLPISSSSSTSSVTSEGSDEDEDDGEWDVAGPSFVQKKSKKRSKREKEAEGSEDDDEWDVAGPSLVQKKSKKRSKREKEAEGSEDDYEWDVAGPSSVQKNSKKRSTRSGIKSSIGDPEDRPIRTRTIPTKTTTTHRLNSPSRNTSVMEEVAKRMAPYAASKFVKPGGNSRNPPKPKKEKMIIKDLFCCPEAGRYEVPSAGDWEALHNAGLGLKRGVMFTPGDSSSNVDEAIYEVYPKLGEGRPRQGYYICSRRRGYTKQLEVNFYRAPSADALIALPTMLFLVPMQKDLDWEEERTETRICLDCGMEIPVREMQHHKDEDCRPPPSRRCYSSSRSRDNRRHE